MQYGAAEICFGDHAETWKTFRNSEGEHRDSKVPLHFSPTEIVLKFPEPIEIPHIDGRQKESSK